METVRFSKVVEASGKPVIHLLWTDPAKDTALKKAIMADRVMTLHQRSATTRTDYGMVGFEKNVPGQILIFPKSLRRFVGKRVIGVKYDLLEWPDVPKSQQADKPLPVRHSGKRRPQENATVPATGEAPATEAKTKVLKFPKPEDDRPDDSNPAVKEIKQQVRLAMDALQEGKQVVAFNVLKRVLSN